MQPPLYDPRRSVCSGVFMNGELSASYDALYNRCGVIVYCGVSAGTWIVD